MSLFGSRLNFAANTITFDSNTARVYGDVKFDDQLIQNNGTEISTGDMGYVTTIRVDNGSSAM